MIDIIIILAGILKMIAEILDVIAEKILESERLRKNQEKKAQGKKN